MSNFDPIPRLQQIAATIEDGGHFDSPATAAHYINCAIREIERLREERDALFVLTDRLTVERDEARRECRLLLLGQEVLRGVRDLPAPPDDLVTIVPVPRKEDGK
jgi:hypothetical protein